MKTAIGLDIGGTFTKIVIAKEDGSIIARGKVSTPSSPEEGAGSAGDILIKNLRKFLDDTDSTGYCGIGIGVAGLIDRKNGKVLESPNISSINGLAIRDLFEREFSLPVVIENDANMYAYGEKWVGAGREFNNFVLLTLGTGLGGGLIYNGELYEGPIEVGHMVIEPKGRFCPCGSYGCLESYASGRALVERVVKAIEEGTKTSLSECCDGNFYRITPEHVYQAALDGDNLARDVFREAGQYLGIGIANLINLFNLDAVIIGGGLIGAWDLFIDEVIKEAKKTAFGPLVENVKIIKSALIKDAGAVGAAGLLFKRLSETSS
jgi:glucokinase